MCGTLKGLFLFPFLVTKNVEYLIFMKERIGGEIIYSNFNSLNHFGHSHNILY